VLDAPDIAARYLGLDGGAAVGGMGGSFRARFADELRRTARGD